MKSCPRTFEVEAMRDGRLVGAARESFERHRATCAVCAHEAAALDALAEAVRETQNGAVDELHVRRERTRLLAAFDSAIVPEERRFEPRRLVWPLVALALAAAAVVVFARPKRAISLAPVVPVTSTVIRAEGTALYSKRNDGHRETIALEQGALWIRVTHAENQKALLVLLPDGELEDTGTTFSVTADNGHTTHVAVEEGSVALRLRGSPPIVLVAGESWSQPPPTMASVAPATSVERSAPPVRAASSVPAIAVPAPRGPDASEDFRAAMSALDAGDAREAAARFQTFLAKHPGDVRAEDAAYLRVIALDRAADETATYEAAREYLRRHPNGFRRGEVEKLLRQP